MLRHMSKKPETNETMPDAAAKSAAERLRRFATDPKHRVSAHGVGGLVVHRGVSVSTALAEKIADLLEK